MKPIEKQLRDGIWDQVWVYINDQTTNHSYYHISQVNSKISKQMRDQIEQALYETN